LEVNQFLIELIKWKVNYLQKNIENLF
jgi:hypothetical protein